MNQRDALKQPSGFGVAEVTIEHDVIAELGLDRIPFSGRILQGLADRGGEAPYPRTKVVMPDGRVVQLQTSIEALEKLGLVEAFTPAIATPATDFAAAMLRLTDKGKNVVTEMAKTRIKVGAVKDLSIEQVIDEAPKQN